jgi:uncharacterized protein YcnI
MKAISTTAFWSLGLAAMLATTCASAHIGLENQKAEAGSYYKAVFKITHGCDGEPIRQIIVNIPEGVQGAKPMVKPGWTIEIERGRLPKPYTALHGRPVTEEVKQLRWTGGPLPNEHYDEFVVTAKLPDAPGKLYWKVSQVCEKGRIDWDEIPAPGKKASDYKAPAAQMELTPRGHAGHQH